jgi:hypothetical protein
MPQFYIKHSDPIHEGYEAFTFDIVDYEITEADKVFIAKHLTQGDKGLSHLDFEKIIDVFEKSVAVDND